MKRQTSRNLRPNIGSMIALLCFASAVSGQDPSDRPAIEIAVATSDANTASTARVPATITANVAQVETEANSLSTGMVDRELVKRKLTQLAAEIKTATWDSKVCEYLGDKTEETTTRVCWAGTGMQRIKVLTGRAAGKTLIIRGDTVHAGWLKFNHTNRMVQTIRGNSLKLNGYLDDVAAIVADWDNVAVHDDAGDWVISFRATTGEDAKLWMNPTTMIAAKLECYDAGQVAGCYEYENVVYNPELPARTWRK